MTFVGQQITHMESRRGCNADRVSNIISKRSCVDTGPSGASHLPSRLAEAAWGVGAHLEVPAKKLERIIITIKL